MNTFFFYIEKRKKASNSKYHVTDHFHMVFEVKKLLRGEMKRKICHITLLCPEIKYRKE